jgi:hypothetical protein
MAKFKYKTIKKMLPKDGVKYSTEYYKQSPAEYTRVDEHIRAVMEQVIAAADKEGILEELEQPMTGFPRTNKRPNYSAMDVMMDMLDQVTKEKDIPSGILGRWNRLFGDNTDFTIDMEEEKLPNPVFNKLFHESAK